MGKNLVEKILGTHLVSGRLIPGEEIAIAIDQTLIQDATGTLSCLQFEALGIPPGFGRSCRSVMLTITRFRRGLRMRTTTDSFRRVQPNTGCSFRNQAMGSAIRSTWNGFQTRSDAPRCGQSHSECGGDGNDSDRCGRAGCRCRHGRRALPRANARGGSRPTERKASGGFFNEKTIALESPDHIFKKPPVHPTRKTHPGQAMGFSP